MHIIKSREIPIAHKSCLLARRYGLKKLLSGIRRDKIFTYWHKIILIYITVCPCMCRVHSAFPHLVIKRNEAYPHRPISNPEITMSFIAFLWIIWWCTFLGDAFMIPFAGGSWDNAASGHISPKRSIARICTAVIAICAQVNIDQAIHRSTAKSSARLVVIHESIFLVIFLKITLHWLIAATKLEKLSSNKIISAASLATSVQVFHIATPICAVFNAGASFTPSQVTATICPSVLQWLTILTLSSGDTLEKIADHGICRCLESCTLLIRDKSFQVNVSIGSEADHSHTFSPIASAVFA